MSSVDFTSYNDAAVLTDSHVLTTTVTNSDGTSLTSSLDLNTVIGNVNGAFSWGGTNFTEGAQNIQMTDGFQLEADLPDGNGKMAHSLMYIGSKIGTGPDGKPAIQHTVGTDHSSAHAAANDNHQADGTVASQAQTLSGSSEIGSVTTITGDASKYWPDGNAPAAGNSHSRERAQRIWEIIRFIIECLERFR